MGVLDEVMQMQSKGIEEQNILNLLKNKYSPREISDAISQSKIKNAIAQEDAGMAEIPPAYDENPQQTEEMYEPSTQDFYEAPPQIGQETYAPEQQYAPMENYESYSPSSGTDTMIEIAEQVFAQKMQKMQKQIEELTEFKTIAQSKIEMSMERLKRIESTIDKLQLAILDKVGSYQNTLRSIKDEMSMMQNSFSKIAHKKRT